METVVEDNSRSKWMIGFGKRGNKGLKNLEEKILVAGAERAFSGYELTHCFSNRSTSIIDWKGKTLRTKIDVESFSEVSDGMLGVRSLVNERSGYMSIEPDRFPDMECQYYAARSFHRGVAVVEQYVGYQKSRWGLIDKSGEFVIPPMYLDIGDFKDSCDVAPYLPFKETRDDKVWGLINRKGEIVVPPGWSAICEGFSEGCLVAQESTGEDDGNWGLVDPAGHWAISPVWESLSEHVNEGSIGARKQGRWGVIDLKGNWIVDAKFGFCAAFHEGVARAMIKDKQGDPKRGFIDVNGNWIIEPKYDDCEDFRFGLAEVSIYNEQTDTVRTGYVDKSGFEYWEGI